MLPLLRLRAFARSWLLRVRAAEGWLPLPRLPLPEAARGAPSAWPATAAPSSTTSSRCAARVVALPLLTTRCGLLLVCALLGFTHTLTFPLPFRQGCDALTCGGCGCPFCALCLAPFPTGHAAHQHVGAARHHADGFIGLHGGLNRFRAYHAQRQRTAIDDFVARLREPDDFKDELVRTLVNDGELHGVPGRGGGAWGPPDAAGGGVGGAAAAGDNGAGAWWRGLGGLVVFAAELMGPRENQGAFTRGVRAVLDLALLAAPLLSRAAAPAPANAAADAERRKRTSTATTVAVAAGAAAVVAGGAAWAIASAAEKEKAERERRERGEDVD